MRVWGGHSTQSWSTPRHPPRLPWFHSRYSSEAGNKHQPVEHHKINQKATQKQQTSNKTVVKAACESASSSPDLLPTVRVAETCHSAEDAGDRREQQTASHPYTSAAAVIRI